jgi:hypothetical protein
LNTNDKYNHYSIADIRKYLQGDLSAREMQALEAEALEDPFLADALDGIENDLRLRGEVAFQKDMSTLRDRLARRLSEKDKGLVMPLYRSVWKVAAAIILLAGLGAITYRYLLTGPSAPTIASTVTKDLTLPADSIRADRSKPLIKDQEPKDSGHFATAAAPPQQMAISSRTSAHKNKALVAESVAGSKAESAAEPSTGSNSEILAKASPHLAPPAPRLRALEAIRPDSSKNQKDQFEYPSPVNADKKELFANSDYKTSGVASSSADNANKGGQFLIGKVTDRDNKPIPLITISIAGHQRAVRTDNRGLFHVQMLGSDSTTPIRIGSSGFETVEVPAYVLADRPGNSGVANTIRLQSHFDGPAGYAATNDSRFKKSDSGNQDIFYDADASQKNIVQQAAPTSGWPLYKSYLEKNKIDRSIDATRKGTEAVSFKVSKKGHLSSFKVESSLSPAHDALLLHLIKQGSSWRPLNGHTGSATVVLSY